MWHAYGTGSAEEKALTQALDALKTENPDLKVNVLQIPFDQVFNKWETEVAAGGGPDMFTAPNDNTGNQVRAKLLAPVDDLIKGKTDGFPPACFDGATVDGKMYGVPGIIKAVALYYNKSTVPNPAQDHRRAVGAGQERQEDRHQPEQLPQLRLADRRVRRQADG